MTPPTPTRDFLAAQVRWAMGRGLPAEIAEDAVFTAWQKAVEGFDPKRGVFEAYMQKVVRNECAYWWRRHARGQRAEAALRLLPGPDELARLERAFRNQTELLEALDTEERTLFAAWALQKHLGKGRVTAVEMSASLGMGLREYENAKRRLRDQLQRVLNRFGWSVSDLLYGDDDVDQTG